jgi:hypothetical protein
MSWRRYSMASHNQGRNTAATAVATELPDTVTGESSEN